MKLPSKAIAINCTGLDASFTKALEMHGQVLRDIMDTTYILLRLALCVLIIFKMLLTALEEES